MIDDISKTMHSGCFVRAAFGLIDPDAGIGLFNGTDEGEEIRRGGSIPALSPLPYSASVAQFSGFPGNGSYMYMHTYFPGALDERRDSNLRRYKEVATAANFLVTDDNGQPLPVNATAFAYSARGQWMVTESPGRSLVRVNLATYAVLPFAPSYFMTNNPYATHSASMAITEDGRYAAAASNEYKTMKVYDLRNCSNTTGSGVLTPKNCPSYDYWPYIKAQVTGTLQRISQVRFVSDSLISFTATTTTGTDSYLLSPQGPITSLIPYLGLGDSYASGQGAWNYIAGTDTAINKCHLSVHAYPLRLNGDVFGNRGHSVACSGARLRDIGSQSPDYIGQAGDHRTTRSRQADGSETAILHDFTPGYLAQQDFVRAYQPGVITIEIGGNDVGFKDMMLRCASPVASVRPPATNPSDCYTTYEDRLEVAQTIDSTYANWVTLFSQLHKQAPAARIYVIGYPHIVSPVAKCSLNAPLSGPDIAFARDVTLYLNSVILKATQAAGVTYVDIADALKGHELCSGQAALPAVNGVTAGTDAMGVLGQESFHPTAFGHELIEQAVLKATRNFAAPSPAPHPTESPPTVSDNNPLLQAPRSGRAITQVMTSDDMTTSHIVRGSTLPITITGATYGLRPNSDFTVIIGSTAVGNVHSSSAGDINGATVVPAESPPGNQPVSVTGPGQNGDPVTVVEVVYIGHSGEDFDDDGIPNFSDSCPTTTNANIDEDGDGIDDVCDTSVGATANPPVQQPGGRPEGAASIQSFQATASPQQAAGMAVAPTLRTRLFSGDTPSAQSRSRDVATSSLIAWRAPGCFLWYVWLGVLIGVIVFTGSCRHYANK